jgi:Peptidase family M28
MDFSNRFGLNALLVSGALFLACGSDNQTTGSGSTGGGGSGGSGGSGMSDAGDDGSVDPPGDMDAMSNDAMQDRSTPGRDGASSDGARGADTRTDGSAVDAATPRPDVATPMDASTPPTDARPPPTDVMPPPGDSSTPEDLIREMLARFDVVEMEARYRELESKSLPDRSAKSANYLAITEWIRDMLAAQAPAAVVKFDEWDGYRNVEITIAGTDPTAGVYFLGGHLDGVKNTVAMDDNGSGGLGMALIAREMAHYKFKAEVRCVIFDAEELGLIGSAHYTAALKTSCPPTTCGKAYINLDEVAYDPQNRRGIRVWSDSVDLKNLHTHVNTTYGLGLALTLGTGSCHRSDDCSFSEQGYPTLYNFQSTQSPYYHLPGDTADTLNYTTLMKVLQVSAGVIATAAVPVGRVP